MSVSRHDFRGERGGISDFPTESLVPKNGSSGEFVITLQALGENKVADLLPQTRCQNAHTPVCKGKSEEIHKDECGVA
jgi:hypothetical protein